MRFPLIDRPAVYAVILVSLLPAGQARSQNPDLVINVGDCIVLEAAVERFACYEKQVEMALTGEATPQPSRPQSAAPGSTDRPSPVAPAGENPAEPAAPASPPRVTTAAPPAPAPAAARESSPVSEDFGLPSPREEARQAEELLSVISALREVVPNRYVFTLENGQVWRQVRAEPRLHPRVGHHVRIYRSRFGDDLRLSIDELNLFVQVERVE